MRIILALMICGTFSFAGDSTYDRFFTGRTMRVDLIHTGTADEEIYSLDQILAEGEWPGSPNALLDTLNLGKYLFKVYDTATNRLVFSRGFCTVFGEWQTTPEAKSGVRRSMHETVRFPFPREKVQLCIASRDRDNVFRDTFSLVIDPDDRGIRRETVTRSCRSEKIIDHGPPAEKVDLLLLGDGYRAEEMETFRAHARHYTRLLFETTPFRERCKEFNVWIIEAVSEESGIDQPRENRWQRTALGTSYNSFDSPRYVLTLENKTLRDISAAVPYDCIYILTHSSRYGGGGIFNWFATCYTGRENDDPAWWSDYVFVHEFGHLFAGLGDEYYTSNVSYDEFYPLDVEPWEPNLTTTINRDELKWRSLIDPGTPVPTPWNKAAYDSLSTLLRRSKNNSGIAEQIRRIREQSPWSAKAGCFEGAGYQTEGLYRPAIDCRMFSKSLVDFCPVCREAIERMIDFTTGK